MTPGATPTAARNFPNGASVEAYLRPLHVLLAEPLLIFVATRSGLFALAYVAQLLLPRPVGSGYWDAFPGNLWLSGWLRWDSGWYLDIARRGYWLDPQTHLGSVAFFPLYPLLMRVLGQIIGSIPAAGLVISNLAFAAALALLYDLTARRAGRDVARRTLLFLCVFPFSVFFSAVYTESLFLLLVVLSFWLAERGRWWWSGTAGLLCALTRSVGVALGPALFLLYLNQRSWNWRKVSPDLLASALIPLGTALYMGYLGVRFGDPLAFAKGTLAGWRHYNPWVEGFSRLNPVGMQPGDYDLVLLLNALAALACLLAVVPTRRLLGSPYATFVLLATLMSLPAGFDSVGRYVTVIFPVFIVLGYYVRRPLAAKVTFIGSAALLGLFTALFVNWYWIV